MVVDTCIISALAKIGRLSLLRHFGDIATPAGVVEEIMNSEIPEIITAVTMAANHWLPIKVPSDLKRLPTLQQEHPALSLTDCELILLASELKCAMLSDDAKLLSVASDEFGMAVFDLCDILLSLRNGGILREKDILDIISALEKKDHYRFSKDGLALLMQ